MAQLNAKNLMVVPSTGNAFRTAVSALGSLDGKESATFHTFTLPEDGCVRLLVKNLGRGMPESFVREELESLINRVQRSLSCVPAVATRTPPRAAFPAPTSSYQWREIPRCPQSLAETCGLRVSVE